MKTWKRTLVALMALMLLVAACGKKADTAGTGTTETGSGSGDGAEALQAAVAELGGDQPYEMTFMMTFEGMPDVEGMDMSGLSMNGVFAEDPSQEATQFSFTMDMPEGAAPGMPAGAGAFSMEMIIIGEDAWISMPMLSGMLGSDAKWIHASASELGPEFAQMGGSPFGSDPTEMLAGIDGIEGEGVTNAGSETIDGIETTRYDLTLDYGAMLSSGSLDEETKQQVEDMIGEFGGTTDVKIPMSIWIDGEGLPRQIQMSLPAGAMMGTALGQGSEDASIVMTMNLTSYGEEVTIEAPPADETVEGDQIPGFSDALGGGGASTGGGGEMPEIPEMPSGMPEIPEMPAA